MSNPSRCFLVAALLYTAACSSDSDSNTPAAGGTESTGSGTGGTATGSGGTGGNMGEPPQPSGLPMPPATGVAQPAAAAANLRVLPWAGFKAAISYTFDDTNSSQIANYAALNALGVPFTFYLQTNKPTEFNNPVWVQALTDGHELGNHTRSHLNAGNPMLAMDTDAGETDIETKFNITVYTMASPFGAADYIEVARTRYLINRGVNDATIAATGSVNPFSLPCFVPRQDAPITDFNTKIDTIRSGAGSWQTVLLHGFNGGTDGAYQPVPLATFEAAVNYAKSFGDVWVDTVLEVGAYWRGQAAFAAATQTPDGGSTTYTWTLPDHFPPGKHLRVTADGGTLTQDGATLPWDEHGFYEIALDKLSVTLSP